MRRIPFRASILLAAGLASFIFIHQQVAASPAVVKLDPASLSPAPMLGTLDESPSEAPRERHPGPMHCTACRLAARTTGQLSRDALQVSAEPLEHGLVLRVSSKDPVARDVLWKATIARGELLAGLRAGEALHLCDECSASLQRFRDLRISARRTPDGVVVVYSSASDDVVHTLHEIGASLGASAQF